MTVLDPPRYSVLSPFELSKESDTPSWGAPIFVDGNLLNGESQRGAITKLIGELRLPEIREMTIDIMDVGLVALQTRDLDPLREALVNWMATADVLIATRRDRRAILDAREEGRAKFGTIQRPLASERRKVPRKKR